MKKEQIQDIERQIKFYRGIAWLCVGLGMVFTVIGVLIYFNDSDKSATNLSNLGNLGSYLQGAVGSLWALAGLMFIYVAFLGQRQQLVKQDEAFEAQEKQFILQQESIKEQNFESSFFQLLHTFNEIVPGMRDTKHTKDGTYAKPIPIEGRDCFSNWNDWLHFYFNEQNLEVIANVKSPDNKKHEVIVKLFFEELYKQKQAILGHYFRVLYHTIKFVDSSKALKTHEDKKRYVSLIRAHLSAYELVIIFYNGICPIALKFRPLIEKYGLLEHLDKSLLLDESHVNFYNKAYK